MQVVTTTTTITTEEKYRVLAPESMQETFMSDSEDEGGEYWVHSTPKRFVPNQEFAFVADSVSDPDLHWFGSPGSESEYWECGSGSRSQEINQNLQINLIFNLSKWYLYLYLGIFYDILPT